MIQSTPFITPVEPEPVATTSVLPSQVSYIQTTQIQPQVQPVIASQVIPSVVASQPVPQVSYVPVTPSIQTVQPSVRSGVKVVPIYDDF